MSCRKVFTDNRRLIQLLNNLREQMYRYRIEYLKKKEELKTYDPEGYELMKHIYPEKTLPEPWHYNVNIYDIDGKPYKSYDENMKFNWDFIQ